MILGKLTLNRFKGMSIEIDLSTGITTIYGDNATGKTTVSDAYYWLLTGKDAAGQTDFEIKTIGSPTGEHSVSGNFSDDSGTFFLSRTYREKWTKKKGSSESEMTGHETIYQIDGIPKTMREYQDFIAERLGSEEEIRIAGDPLYFSSVLPWKKRRDRLMQLVGEPTIEQILARNQEVSGIVEALSGKTCEDRTAQITAEKKKINDELKQLPARIDEVQRAISLPAKSERTLIAERVQLNESAYEIRIRQATGDRTAELSETREKIDELESEKSARRTASQASHETATAGIREQRKKLVSEIEQIEFDRSSLSVERSRVASNLDRMTARLADLRADHDRLKASAYTPGICKSCNRPLDEIEGAESSWNIRRAEQMEKCLANGRAVTQEIDMLNKHILDLTEQIQGKDEQIIEKRAELESLVIPAEPIFAAPGIDEEIADLNGLRDGILAGQKSGIDQEELSKINGQLKKVQSDIAAHERAESARLRVDELCTRQRDLSGLYDSCEKRLFIIEQFIVARVRMIEQSVSEKFRLARFRMFAQQINGGIVECCDVLDEHGVPFVGGLNHGAQINVGIDIIRNLGCTLPIWIDNAESVTRIEETEQQQIRLIVSENDKTLRIEGEKND